MDFFVDFRSGNPGKGWHRFPGMLLFLIVGVPMYHILFFRLVRPVLRHVYSTCSWWPYLSTYKGLLCQDVQKEIQYTSLACIHHLVAGGLMACGGFKNDPRVWAFGALIGCIDDIHGMVCMFLPAWPFGGAGEKADRRFTALASLHHTTALLISILCIVYNLHSNMHVQSVGTWLLLAGGCSHFGLTLSRTRNRTDPRHAFQDVIIGVLGCLFFFYSRFYAFPCSMIALFREEYHKLNLILKLGMVFFTLLMGLFNTLLGLDAIKNIVKRLRNAARGFQNWQAEQPKVLLGSGTLDCKPHRA